MTLELILLIIALVCFIIAALGYATRINLIAAGLACVVAAQLVPLVH